MGFRGETGERTVAEGDRTSPGCTATSSAVLPRLTSKPDCGTLGPLGAQSSPPARALRRPALLSALDQQSFSISVSMPCHMPWAHAERDCN